MSRRLPLPCALAGLVLLAACGPSTPTPAAGPAPAAAPAGATGPAISAEDLQLRLVAYAHDSMLGREAGTIGNYRATSYIAAELARIGLEPGGEDGYFQVVPLTEQRVDPASRLAVGGAPLTLGTDYLPLPPIQNLPVGLGGPLDGVTVIYGGRMGDSLSITPAQGAGKLVLFDAQLGRNGAPAFSLNRQVLSQFADARAIAIANLDLAPPQLIEFLSQPQASMGEPPTGTASAAPLALFVTADAARRLLGAELASSTRGATGGTLSGTVRFRVGPPAAPARNVIGILRGSDPALRGSYIAVGAHNDHIGLAATPVDHDSLWAFNHVLRPEGAESQVGQPTAAQLAEVRRILDSLRALRPPRADSVFNGADDDGSGTVTVLEVAQAMAAARVKPRRSLLFVWHTGEEKGLWGSQWFTDHPTVPLDSIVAQINIDMVGRGGARDLAGGGPGYMQLIGSRRLSTELGNMVEQVNTSGRYGFAFDYQFDADGHPQNYYCRSDHYMYARYGIPVVFMTTGSHQDYHQLTDEAQYIDYGKMARVARFVAGLATSVADLDHRVVVDKPKPDPNAPCRQ